MNIEDMTHEQLLDYLSGESIMKLGRGSSIRDIVWMVFEATCRWNQDKKKKK